VTLTNVVVRENIAYRGGGISVGTLLLRDSVDANRAERSGGSVDNGVTMTVRQAMITNNVSEDLGGGAGERSVLPTVRYSLHGHGQPGGGLRRRDLQLQRALSRGRRTQQ
jgi:hypothetical protein